MHRTSPAFHDYGQVRLDHDQPLQNLLVVAFRIPIVGEAQVQLLHEQTEDHPNLLHCQPLAHAIGRSIGERNKCACIVYELLSGCTLEFLKSGGNEPAIGPESVGLRGEVTGVVVQHIEGQIDSGFWWYVTALFGQPPLCTLE